MLLSWISLHVKRRFQSLDWNMFWRLLAFNLLVSIRLLLKLLSHLRDPSGKFGDKIRKLVALENMNTAQLKAKHRMKSIFTQDRQKAKRNKRVYRTRLNLAPNIYCAIEDNRDWFDGRLSVQRPFQYMLLFICTFAGSESVDKWFFVWSLHCWLLPSKWKQLQDAIYPR